MDNNVDKTQSELELDIKVRQVKSLIALCDDRGITSPVAESDVDGFVEVYYRDRTENGLYSLNSRLRLMHKALHELLYAPLGR